MLFCVATSVTYAAVTPPAPAYLTCAQLRTPASAGGYDPSNPAHQLFPYHLECMFESFLGTIIMLVGLVALIFLIWGGFKYITSQGDQKATASARDTLTYAVIGVVLAVVSYFVIDYVAKFSGLNGVSGRLDLRELFIPRPF